MLFKFPSGHRFLDTGTSFFHESHPINYCSRNLTGGLEQCSESGICQLDSLSHLSSLPDCSSLGSGISDGAVVQLSWLRLRPLGLHDTELYHRAKVNSDRATGFAWRVNPPSIPSRGSPRGRVPSTAAIYCYAEQWIKCPRRSY